MTQAPTSAPNRVPSTQLTPEDIKKSLKGSPKALSHQVDLVTNFNFQQAINCCGFTSVAYALTALGCPTTVDEIFWTVGVNVESAVGDGMTLAEVYDASLRYVSRAKLPIFVECYHFDTFSIKPDDFWRGLYAEADSGIDDLLILNFHSGIAHGWPTGGGGHFSVLTALDSNEQRVIMSDVHGIKYGAHWSTPFLQMFEACENHDSTGRARGALRFGRTDRNVKRPLDGMTPTQVDWANPPPAYKNLNLARYIPEQWDELLGVKNMEGVSALASAIRLLEGGNSPIASLDGIMRELRESYTFHLNNFLEPQKLMEMANALNEKGQTNARASLKTMSYVNAESLRKALLEVGCGREGVAVLAAYNVNDAHGAEFLPPEKGEAGALSHGVKSWSLIAAVDEKAKADDNCGVVVAPAHYVIVAGRMWSCSLNRMAAAMHTIGGDQCTLIAICRT